jgi:hypothetical protein
MAKYFCPDCQYEDSSPGMCPHCNTPLENLAVDEPSKNPQTYPKKMIGEEEPEEILDDMDEET